MPKIEMPTPEPEPTPEPIAKIHSEVEADLPEISQVSDRDGEPKDDLSIDEISDEEIFDETPTSNGKIVPVQAEIATEFSEPVKKGKRKYVRKQAMSQKQIDHLAKIRVIASERRAQERVRKAQEKEDALVAKAEKKILDKQKKKRDEEQAESVQEKEEEKPVHRQENVSDKATPLSQNSFTKDDLDNAVLSAITSYDQLRKKQKSEKKIQQKKDEEEAKMKRVIQNAITPQPIASDPWRNLFT